MSDAHEDKISRKRKLNAPNKDKRESKGPKKNHRYENYKFGECTGC